MGLTNKKEEQLKRMPLIESKVLKSKDGKYVIHRTTITTIRPTAYFEKVLESEGVVTDSEVADMINSVNLEETA
ncbi:MAG: hypothetical protein AB7V77_05475 [Candidatus Woesearchaeota archaeon]